MINHPNRRRDGPRLYMFKLTMDEINAILAASGNADWSAMAEDYETEAEGEAFLRALQSATDKLHGAR